MPWFVVRLHIFFSFIHFFLLLGSIGRCPGSGRKTQVTEKVLAIVDSKMREDDETTACQLHALLNSKGYSLSLRTILRSRFCWDGHFGMPFLFSNIIIMACIFNLAFIDFVNCLHIIFIVEAHTAN